MRVDRRTLFAATLAAAAAGGAGSACAQGAATAPLSRIAPPASGSIRVAFLVDRFHNIMDLASGWEPFAAARIGEQRFERYTVSPVRETLRLGGVQMLPDYTLDDAPQPHIVWMGAQGAFPYDQDNTASNEAKSAWLRRVEPQAQLIASTCTGAFVLARSGLIDGKMATTHHDYYEDFASQFPQVQLVRDRRFVDNGKFVSGGGLTSGVDAALHIIARYGGDEEAQRVATYIEHYSDGWRSGLITSA